MSVHEPYWYDDHSPTELDRLTHLVLVDGRLVDVWSEPVAGTRWQSHADRFDRERRADRQPPPVPPYERVLQWLDEVCGGRPAVLSLDDEPLVDDGLDAPEDLPAGSDVRRLLDDAAALLDLVCEQWFDAETSYAFRRALLRVWTNDPWCVRNARSAAHLAGGVCWAVGKANDLFPARGGVTMSQVQGTLGLGAALSTHGQKVRSALVGMHAWSSGSRHGWHDLPRIEPIGHADLLVASVRSRLVRARDRAFTAQTALA